MQYRHTVFTILLVFLPVFIQAQNNPLCPNPPELISLLDQEICYRKGPQDTAFLLSGRITYDYELVNGEFKRSQLFRENYLPPNGPFQNGILLESQFDMFGRDSISLRSFWINNQWDSTNLYSQTYQSFANGEILDRQEDIWQNGSRSPFIRERDTLDSNEQLLSRLTENWDSPLQDWIPSSLERRQYNNGLLEVLTRLSYQVSTQSWMLDKREIYTYTSNGINARIEFEQWDDAIQAYLPTSRHIFVANALGLIDTFLIEQDNGNGWEPIALEENTYDSCGNRIERILSNRVNANTAWEVVSIDSAFYDPYGNQVYAITYNWDVRDKTLPQGTAVSCHYSYLIPTQTRKKIEREAFVIPNPVHSLQRIQLPFQQGIPFRLSLVDLKGRHILDKVGIGPTEISLPSLSKGIYFLRLIENDQLIQTAKLQLIE
ncbi:MAG: T9SS type A sorting domain-containing protein [Bacteroidota bacterium]